MAHSRKRTLYQVTRLTAFLCISFAILSGEAGKEMNWVAENALCCMKHFEGQTSLVIRLKKSLLDQLPKELHHLFSTTKTNEQISFTFTYGKDFKAPIFKDKQEFFNQDKTENSHYFLHTPLFYKDNKAQNVTFKQLAALLHSKQVAWYTGAGISAGTVPTMNQLEESLGFIGKNSKEKLLSFISRALQKPQQICSTMDDFFYQCNHGKPTKAHEALANYLSKKEELLFTENLDLLHEQAGSSPTRIDNPNSFKKNYTLKKLQNIDCIICIGLSHDDRGFLGYYKTCNPTGKLLALCLEQPTYLSKTDYFMKDDAQKILPKLVKVD